MTLEDRLARADIPVANPECEIIFTEAGWYEWKIPGVVCEYGYHTWREAHQAGRVVLRDREINKLKGKITGSILHLDALCKAVDKSDRFKSMLETLGRLKSFLEE